MPRYSSCKLTLSSPVPLHSHDLHLTNKRFFSASSAGISIPTDDPGLLLSLAPVAAQLASYLPTAPVLSALQTAVPSNFISNIIHDPSYAASFESQFAAGSSPSWFLSLPSSVKDYLHTYSDYGGLATEVGNAESILQTAAASASASGASASVTTGSAFATGTDKTIASQSSTGSVKAGATATNASSSSMDSAGAASSSSVSSGSESSASASESSAAASSSTSEQLSEAAAQSSLSATSTAAASQETAAIAVGVAAAAGILGLALVV
jgi:hypothetical protein